MSMTTISTRGFLRAWLTGGGFTFLFIGAVHAARSPAVGRAAISNVKLTESMGDSGSGDNGLGASGSGLHGYISMKVTSPARGADFGVSFYSDVFPLLAKPLQSFQIGMPPVLGKCRTTVVTSSRYARVAPWPAINGPNAAPRTATFFRLSKVARVFGPARGSRRPHRNIE